MSLDDYYYILGIDKEASVNEIKTAFRKKAKQFHPDLNPNKNAREEFIKINEAYRTLLNKKTLGQNKESVSYEEWVVYRRERARREAAYFARKRYKEFTQSKLYKTTKSITKYLIFIYSLIGAFMFISPIIYTIINGIDKENPGRSIVGVVFVSLIGVIFMVFLVGTRKDYDF